MSRTRRRPSDPWFPITILLVVLLGVWLGIAGPVLDDVAARGFWGTLKEWQTLVGASIAVGAAFTAWHNVTRQLHMTARMREEDRMESALPGLREAQDLLEPLLDDLQALHGKENADQIVRSRFVGLEETFTDLARRKLPSANERLRREVADMMLRLRSASKQLAIAYAGHQAAHEDLRNISKFATTEHEKLRDMEREAREANFAP
jgi:hypothetical protein